MYNRSTKSHENDHKIQISHLILKSTHEVKIIYSTLTPTANQTPSKIF